jgi:hypothetical protein
MNNPTLRSLLDDVRSLLGNSVHRRLKMRSRDQRNNTGVDNTELLYTVHLELVADTSAQVLRHHAAASARVSKRGLERPGRNTTSNDLLVGLVLRARRGLDGVVHGKFLGRPVSAVELRQSDHDVGVNGVLEGVPLHDGVGGRVRVVERDGATRQRLVVRYAGETDGLDNNLADSGVALGELVSEDLALLHETGHELLVRGIAGGQEVGGNLRTELGDSLREASVKLLQSHEDEAVGFPNGVRAGAILLVLLVSGLVEGGIGVERVLILWVHVLEVEVHVVGDMVLEVGAYSREVL